MTDKEINKQILEAFDKTQQRSQSTLILIKETNRRIDDVVAILAKFVVAIKPPLDESAEHEIINHLNGQEKFREQFLKAIADAERADELNEAWIRDARANIEKMD